MKKGFKKLVATILCMVLFMTTLVACGGKQETSGSETSDSKDNKEITLTYALWDKNQEPIYRQVADQFEEKNPHIKIKIELTPYKQYWTKLETEATGDNLADVFWMNGPRFGKYAKAKLLMPITDKINQDNIDLTKYPSGLVDLYTLNEENYAIPKDWDTSALWYNKEIFDNANIPYPDETWDWEKLREVAKELTDESKGIYGIAAPQEDQCGYYNTAVAAGGFIISKDRKTSGYDLPETIQGIQCWIDLLNDGSSPNAQQLSETNAGNLFQSGKVAMTFQGSWMIPEFLNNEYTKDRVDLAVMPKLNDGRGAVIHGVGNMINANTKYPEEAWQFVKYLASKEANEIVAKSGVVIPAHKDVLQTFVDGNPSINLSAYVDALDYAQMYPCSIETAKWNEAEYKYIKQVWAGNMTSEEAGKAIAEEMNKVLQAE